MSNDLWASLVDEPMAQLHGSASQLSNDSVEHNTRTPEHKQGEEESLMQTPEPSAIRAGECAGDHVASSHQLVARVQEEPDEEQDVFAQF
jgi:hypothetical protein